MLNYSAARQALLNQGKDGALPSAALAPQEGLSPCGSQAEPPAANATYKLPVKRVENYSGEHREWIEEYVIPKWLVEDIQRGRRDLSPFVSMLRELAASCKATSVEWALADDDDASVVWLTRGETYAFTADQIERGVWP